VVQCPSIALPMCAAPVVCGLWFAVLCVGFSGLGFSFRGFVCSLVGGSIDGFVIIDM